ncbi:MAG: nuclear transport factor 2 family protein, partial [Planctomycetaceae bacterium]|nr:nuclear transport factor 2 family protein [Planctomycetaceae bacterium]
MPRRKKLLPVFRSSWQSLSPAALLSLAICLPAAAQTAPAADDARAADRTAVRGTVENFVKSFAARDAKALAALWTSDGEFQNVQGVTVQGREALEKAFALAFARTSELK